jgi:hypothetical protein
MAVLAALVDSIVGTTRKISDAISGQRLLTRRLQDSSPALERQSEPVRILSPGVPPARRDSPGPARSHHVANFLLERVTDPQRGEMYKTAAGQLFWEERYQAQVIQPLLQQNLRLAVAS